MIILIIVSFVIGVLCGVILSGNDTQTQPVKVTENIQWKNLMEYDGTLRGQENYENK